MIPESLSARDVAPLNGKDAGLAAMRCRDDILQALYWLRGEGFGADADADAIARLVTLDAGLVREQLAQLVGEGLLEARGSRFQLTDAGSREGGRRFADEFADLQLTAHGECAPDCPHCEGIDRAEGCSHCVTGQVDGAWAW
ncbi:MAG: hypothetical protein H0V87_03750 [Chloroflexi bacterium]|nr:hypothetical protein [Chloroflexota bacterium]